MPEMFLDFQRVDELITQGYITKRKHSTAPLFIYNYTAKTQYSRMWTPETIACRGLIIHEDGTVVAKGFDKFFNLGETPETAQDALEGRPFEATVKIDGSLGIIYHRPDGWAIATRGSFEGDQAMWATAFLRKNHAARLDEIGHPRRGLTLLVEIVYPENRVVLDYGRDERLVLIGARAFEPATGKLERDYDHSALGRLADDLGLPVVESTGSVLAELLEGQANARGIEGWVLRFDDGLRVKVKTQQYLELHRAIFGLTPERIREALIADTFAELEQALPEELQPGARETARLIDRAAQDEEVRVRRIFASVQETVGVSSARGDFARHVIANFPNERALLFSLLDGHQVMTTILKTLDLSVVLGEELV